MRIALLTLIIFLSSCGKDDAPAAPSCTPTKGMQSVWIGITPSSVAGASISMVDCPPNTTCTLSSGSTCLLKMAYSKLTEYSGKMTTYRCNDTLYDLSDWSIGCDNKLNIKNSSVGDPDELYQ